MDGETTEVLKELVRLLKAGQSAAGGGAAYAGAASQVTQPQLRGQQSGKRVDAPFDEAWQALPVAVRGPGRFILGAGELTNSLADLFTADQEYHDCVMLVTNKDSSDRTVGVQLQTEGGTARYVAYTDPLPAGSPHWVSVEFGLRKAEKVRGLASANSALDWVLLGRKRA